MTLSQKLHEHIAAAFSGIWLVSHENQDAIAEISRLCRDNRWQLAVWDVDRGLQVGGQAAPGASDPVAAIKSVSALLPENAAPDASALLVLTNFHRFMNSTEVIEALARQIHEGKQNRSFLIVLSPIVQIPLELEKHFVVIEHDLPNRDQLAEIARGVATEPGELPRGAGLDTILDAAAGLTRMEAEGAFSLSLVRSGAISPESIWELKAGMLKKSGLLQLHRGSERFSDLGGLDALKSFCGKALASRPAGSPVKPRGIMLLGVPGTGKSAFARSLGNETGRPTLVLDVGNLMGSLVGATEQNVRRALRIADAMAPCLLFVDEVEKALAGAASSGQTDSGVSARLFGSLLTWLSDHESDVFVVCTANDVSKLPPEFVRAERFDGVFFLDLPSCAEREVIWRLYQTKFQIGDQKLPDANDWTGAEIRSCCRLSRLLEVSLVEAAKNVVPVAVTAAESVERLRSWASGRCLCSHRAGIYTREPATAGRRRVARSTSAN